MIIKMLTDARGCPDGFTQTLYRKSDEPIEVPDHLGHNFVVSGYAEELGKVERPEAIDDPDEGEEQAEAKPDIPEATEEDEIVESREDAWEMKMEPGKYLFRFPTGPKAALARYVLGLSDDKPE